MKTLTGMHDKSRRSFYTGTQKSDGIGWISKSTYQDLPPRFQALARNLATAGEIEIEGEDV